MSKAKKETRICDWCGKEYPADEAYYPWDWIVCQECFEELDKP